MTIPFPVAWRPWLQRPQLHKGCTRTASRLFPSDRENGTPAPHLLPLLWHECADRHVNVFLPLTLSLSLSLSLDRRLSLSLPRPVADMLIVFDLRP